jgi:hypothetical protein
MKRFNAKRFMFAYVLFFGFRAAREKKYDLAVSFLCDSAVAPLQEFVLHQKANRQSEIAKPLSEAKWLAAIGSSSNAFVKTLSSREFLFGAGSSPH